MRRFRHVDEKVDTPHTDVLKWKSRRLLGQAVELLSRLDVDGRVTVAVF
jgi:hypothetical protein